MTRRALLVLAVLVLGVAVPTTAWAVFRSTASGTVKASTLKLAAPADGYGSFSCPTSNSRRGTVTLTGWDEVDGASSYVISLDPPSGSTVTRTATGSSAQSLSVTGFPNRGSWVVSIYAKVGTWTGPTWSQTFTC